MDNNSKPMPSSRRNDETPIQFTDLTPDDISIHRRLYTCLIEDTLIGDKGHELHEAMQLFYQEFK